MRMLHIPCSSMEQEENLIDIQIEEVKQVLDA
jgi:hypothetical protein